jgi:prepilin-type N-terminal cleavage/methylation domain-containing protein
MKILVKKKKSGYTLIELSVVMVLIVLIAGTLTSMLGQQVQYLKWWNTQKFVSEDAPLVNNMVVRLFSQADAFRVHTSRTQALNQNVGALTGNTMLLGFAQPGNNNANATKQWGMIEYDATNALIQYSSVTNTNGVLTIAADATWTMASGVADANFTVVNGILNLTLTGPYGGQLTYAATPSL